MLSPSATFLTVAMTGAMGAFLADLDATVPHDRPMNEIVAQLQQVLSRHDVTMDGAGPW